MPRITDTKLFYVLNDTSNEFVNYKWLGGNRSRISNCVNLPWSWRYMKKILMFFWVLKNYHCILFIFVSDFLQWNGLIQETISYVTIKKMENNKPQKITLKIKTKCFSLKSKYLKSLESEGKVKEILVLRLESNSDLTWHSTFVARERQLSVAVAPSLRAWHNFKEHFLQTFWKSSWKILPSTWKTNKNADAAGNVWKGSSCRGGR